MKSNEIDSDSNKMGILKQAVRLEKIVRSRQLRREMTSAEKALWKRLRANRLDGLHFRRQQIIQGYIVDFYCHKARLIVKVDGDVHTDQVEYDQERDRVLSELGFQVLRFQNALIFSSLKEVIKSIQDACILNLPSDSPSLPASGREGARG